MAPPEGGTWRPFFFDACCHAPDATNPDGGPETAPRLPSRHPYSVLLPVGFALPLPLPVARWALTPPFHPCPAAEAVGGLLSVALSLGSPPPVVIRHRVSMEPGLSSHAVFRRLRVRPSSQLAWRIKAFDGQNATLPVERLLPELKNR